MARPKPNASGFGFDATAQAMIDADPNPRVRCHMALIRPDVAMGGLLKTQPGSQHFTDKSKWAKLAKALGDANVIDEGAFDALSGLTSLPFPRPERLGKGETWNVAVVIDPRGNEGLRVLEVKG